jgi:hypothetical protein
MMLSITQKAIVLCITDLFRVAGEQDLLERAVLSLITKTSISLTLTLTPDKSVKLAPFGTTFDAFVLRVGIHRKCPRRDSVWIIQGERKTSQTVICLQAVSCTRFQSVSKVTVSLFA